MKEDELKKNKKSLEEQAQKRIKTGLILNAFGEKNNIKVSQDEVNAEIQKQLRMMPGQEKMVKEYYEKNPSAIDGIRGSIYEEKIINEIKKSGIVNKKQISKAEAEKILKAENEKNLKEQEKLAKQSSVEKKTKVEAKRETVSKKAKTPTKKKLDQKKLAKSNHKLYKLIRINL